MALAHQEMPMRRLALDRTALIPAALPLSALSSHQHFSLTLPW